MWSWTSPAFWHLNGVNQKKIRNSRPRMTSIFWNTIHVSAVFFQAETQPDKSSIFALNSSSFLINCKSYRKRGITGRERRLVWRSWYVLFLCSVYCLGAIANPQLPFSQIRCDTGSGLISQSIQYETMKTALAHLLNSCDLWTNQKLFSKDCEHQETCLNILIITYYTILSLDCKACGCHGDVKKLNGAFLVPLPTYMAVTGWFFLRFNVGFVCVILMRSILRPMK